MAYISESHARHIGHTRPSRRSFDGTESGSQGKQHEKHRHRRRKARMAEEDSGTIYVYRYASDGQDRNDGKRSDGTTEQRDPPSVASAPTYSRNNLVDSESGRSRRQDSVRRRRTSVNEEKPKRAIHREEDIVIDKRHGSLSTRKTVRELDHERAAVNRYWYSTLPESCKLLNRLGALLCAKDRRQQQCLRFKDAVRPFERRRSLFARSQRLLRFAAKEKNRLRVLRRLGEVLALSFHCLVYPA